jgi:hypothetical protein
VRSGPSFHAIPFAKSAAVPATVENRRRKIAELYQKARRFENAAVLEEAVFDIEELKTPRV